MFRTKLVFILIILVIVVVGFFVFNDIKNKPPQQPKISISEEEWDFGKIKEDERPEHIFTISNKGGKDLIISRVRAACGCTATMLSSDHIPPGKTAELKTTFNPVGYDGKIKKPIYIESNDPELPRAKLDIIAEVETMPAPRAFLSNTQWDLGLISQGDSSEFIFTIENKGELDLIIEKIDTSESTQINITIPLVISPKEKEEIIFTYNSINQQLGEIKESIRIYCNDPRRKAFSLRISGYIKEQAEPTVSIFPVVTNFNLLTDLDKESTGKFTLENLGERPLKVVSIKTSADYLISSRSEFEIGSKSKENLQVAIEKDKARDKVQQEKVEEYLYLTIALPIEINDKR